MMHRYSSFVAALVFATFAALPAVVDRAGAGAGSAGFGPSRFHRALRQAGPGGRGDRRHAKSAALARSRAVRGRSVLRVLPPLRADPAPARRARSRVRPAIGRLRLHHLERRLSHHQRACGRRRGRSHGQAHRQARVQGQGHRRGQAHRRGAPEDRSARICPKSRSAIPKSSAWANGWSRSASRSVSKAR